MTLTINTNISSLNAQRNLTKSQRNFRTSMERLSSGLRINSAKDDAAGLAITDRMTSQIRGINQAARNASDGISLAQTAEGAMQEGVNMLQRIRELAVQSANDTNSPGDRASLQVEVEQLVLELGRISETTGFNGINLLDGTFKDQLFQVGANAGETVPVTIENVHPTVLGNFTETTYEPELLGYDMATSAYLVNGTFTGQTNNSTAPHDITGSLGSSSVSLNNNESVKDLVDRINAVEDLTGVSVDGETKMKLTSVSQDGATVYPVTWTFDLTGALTTSVSVVFPHNSTISPLVGAINAVQGSTGITAEYDAANDDVILTSTDGYNIAIGDIQIQDSSLHELSYTTYYPINTNPYALNGPNGNATVSLNSGDSAKELAELVNAQQGVTGVSATAGTKVAAFGFNAAFPATFTLNLTFNPTWPSSTDITFTLNDGSDLTPFIDAINGSFGSTQISAAYDPSNSYVLLSNLEGYNMTLRDLRVVDGAGNSIPGIIRLGGQHSDGTPATADRSLLVGGIGATFGGYIDSTANGQFSIVHNAVTYNSTNPAPPLNGDLTLGGIDQAGAISGSVVTLDSGVSDRTYTIGGYLNYFSEGAFTVTHDGTTHNSVLDAGNPITVIDGDIVSEIDISTREGANEAMTIVDSAISQIDAERSNLGAVQNRFESTISNLQNISENLSAARSRILDADIAKETSEMTKQNILQQAGVSVLSQANQQPQLVLSLLQG